MGWGHEWGRERCLHRDGVCSRCGGGATNVATALARALIGGAAAVTALALVGEDASGGTLAMCVLPPRGEHGRLATCAAATADVARDFAPREIFRCADAAACSSDPSPCICRQLIQLAELNELT